MAYNNVVKPTFLFYIFRCIVTLPYGSGHYMNNNLKGELAVMDSLGIKPNYAVLGRKMVWTGVQLRNTTMVMKGEIVVLRFSTKLEKAQTTRV